MLDRGAYVVLILPDVDKPVLAAPAPLALAWKLLWLATDRYPQGKDLYDAALLAEHTTVTKATSALRWRM
ncbi:hypothetical protein C7C45_03455 [Micromonospora arborensis]|uniref:Uncharacterized protein n=1 Tax=Micromonospora arborensis TaxID=2116518 RepID=A0A318NNP5_9ACTN|nr:hypothetical protein C7C45_03455 [Micromonospora arborensis]